MLDLISILGVPSVTPSPAGIPGATFARTFAGGIGWIALIFVIIGVFLSGGMWAIGAFSNNYQQSVTGKKGFMICAGAALAIGGANAGVQWFYNAGRQSFVP